MAHAKIVAHGLLFSVLDNDKVTPARIDVQWVWYADKGEQCEYLHRSFFFALKNKSMDVIFAIIVRKIAISHQFFTPIFVHEEVEIIVTHAEIVAYGPGRLK